MLPKNVKNYFIELPLDKNTNEFKQLIKEYKANGITDEEINTIQNLTIKDRLEALKKIGIKSKTFIDYYSNSYELPLNLKGDEIFSLDQIIENNKNNFWSEEYSNITDRYLQISSIEGEGSYFYDKETDAVYDVDWSQMDDFMAGKLKPRWKSFYDFLEWYYGDEEE